MDANAVVFWIGAATVAYLSYQLIQVILMFAIRKGNSFAQHQGKWAVVSGASYGIGLEFSHQLASKGMNIVLMARSKDLLQSAAADIEKRHSVKTKVIQVDFAKLDPSVYNQIADQTKDLDVSMLVNNVGMMNKGQLELFQDMNAEEMNQVVLVNIIPQLQLTNIFYPRMIANHFGTIINVSSLSGKDHISCGLLSVYSATKAFNFKFSQCLNEEAVGSQNGVEVACIMPGFVTGKMTNVSKTNPIFCTDETVVRNSLNSLGYGYVSFIPWINHALVNMTFFKLPPFLERIKWKRMLNIKAYMDKKRATHNKDE
eukprot:TRINITY_DN12394_c0_g1_i1.p1 TRINITY_DN12394_c0_g1~~TRINITY_DN12394_c0_g1_i1.p1  ORF type:complete len:314 (+),score=41.66 TRINITY_DN12394_c0_g1_i1:70-1011(+)